MHVLVGVSPCCPIRWVSYYIGKRYCINSAALQFKVEEKKEKKD
jgi:hypothetical protein